MGQKQSRQSSIDTSELLKEHTTTTYYSQSASVENSKILLIEKKNLSYFICCCNCFGLISTKIIEVEMNWMQYIQNKLDRQSKQIWSKNLLYELMDRFKNIDLDQIQSQFLNEIRLIISQYETNRFLEQDLLNQQEYNFQYQELIRDQANSIFEDRKKSGISEKEFYRKIMGRIAKHLEDESHPCNLILKVFQDYIFSYNLNITSHISWRQSFRKSRKELFLNNIQQFCNEIIAFIQFYVNAIDTFYILDKLVRSENLLKCFTEINFISFGITILFLDKRVYQKIFDCFIELYADENMNYQMNQRKLSEWNITQFDIIKSLQLNGSDIELEQNDELSSKSPSVQNLFSLHINNPYQSAIDCLSQLQQLQSPLNQMKIIQLTFKEIDNSIAEYYQKHPNIPNLKCYGTEDLVPILTYVIVKSDIENFGIILKIIEAFTPKQVMSGITGYQLVTIQGCYLRIENYHQLNKTQDRKSLQQPSIGVLSQLKKSIYNSKLNV